MADHLPLSNRDREILHALVQKVRLLSLRQLADHWWDSEVANARRRLRKLGLAGLISKTTVQARTLPEIRGPVATWRPQQDAPEFGSIAHQLQARWTHKAVRSTTSYIATEHAAQLFAGKARGELRFPAQATHDLGVAAIWLRLHTAAADWADAWRGEDLLAHTRRGEKCPDAFIVDSQDQPCWVIEFGGAYDARRVQEFHADCEQRVLSYQIW